MEFSFSKKVQFFITFYTYLLSGYILYSRQFKTSFLSVLIILAAGFAVLEICILASRLILKLPHTKAVSCLVYTLSLVISSVTVFYMFATLIVPEINYNKVSFMLIFIPLIITACFYGARQGYISCSRVSVILVPIILFTLLICWLAFIDNGKGVSLIPSLSFPKRVSTLLPSLILSDSILFLTAAEHSEAKRSITRLDVTAAYAAFCATVMLENIKHSAFFGKSGVHGIDNPIKTILSAVPFADMQELYSVVFLIAFIIKISVYLASSLWAVKKIAKERNPSQLFAICCAPCYVVFILLCLLSRALW